LFCCRPHIELLILAATSHHFHIVCKELNDLADYSQPNAPGALIKACFCAAKLVDINGTETLAQQLMSSYGGGFQVESMADLPYGSGLGTSSILAGVILAAVLRAAGKNTNVESIVHAVMVVEQMLTCGGGWQDNVGGLAPGFKIAQSGASLPIKVSYEEIQAPSNLVDALKDCLVFVYTGKTRLAKNLLQVGSGLMFFFQIFIHLLIHSFVHSFMHAFIRSCMHAFIHSFTHSLFIDLLGFFLSFFHLFSRPSIYLTN